MRELLSAVAGVAVAFLCLRLSRSYVLAIRSGLEIPKALWLALLVIGGATGMVIGEDLTERSALLAVVASLLIVQTPVDLLTRRLARLPTLLALLAAVVVRTFNVIVDGRTSARMAQVIVTVVLILILTGFQRLSPRSLGWGDILLSAPLAFAVSSIHLSSVAVWMFVASSSAAVHGLVARWRVGNRHIPFGPHLLFAAWLVLVFSL